MPQLQVVTYEATRGHAQLPLPVFTGVQPSQKDMLHTLAMGRRPTGSQAPWLQALPRPPRRGWTVSSVFRHRMHIFCLVDNMLRHVQSFSRAPAGCSSSVAAVWRFCHVLVLVSLHRRKKKSANTNIKTTQPKFPKHQSPETSFAFK
jgi:hypothetical protein